MQAKSSELKETDQANNSLADRVRWVLHHHGLQQQELAGVMGVKVDRVKSLVLGRARKLRSEELERLQAAYGLDREWLVSGRGVVPPGFDREEARAPPPLQSQPVEEEVVRFKLAREPMRARPYLPPTSATDAVLLQRVVDATSAAINARGVQLTAERRLRLYWAVFELSIQGGVVNHAAIPPLLALAESTG